MKKQCLILFLIAFLGLEIAHSQTITLQGKVIDKATQKGIPYVNIGFPVYSMGTSSNELGDFVIKIPKERLRDTLFFSSIGYATFKVLAAEMVGEGSPKTIVLTTNDIKLNEFVVKSLDGRKLIQAFLKNRARNYPTEPVLMKVFCRETLKRSGTNHYFAQSEGILEMYKSSVKKSDDHVRLIKGRKKNLSNVYEANNQKYVLPEIVNGPTAAVSLDIVKNREYFLLQDYQFHFTHSGFKSINDRLAYIVDFTPKDSSIRFLNQTDFDFYKGQIYLDTATFALVRAEFELSPRGLRASNIVLKNEMAVQNRKYVVNYSEFQDKWTIKSLQVENQYIHSATQLYVTHKMESYVTELKTDSVKKFSFKTEILQNESLGKKIPHFDDSFWEDYNFVKSTDVENTAETIEANEPVIEPLKPVEKKDTLITIPMRPLSINTKNVVFTSLSFNEALKSAALQGKGIYIDFYADWCKPCKQMEREVFSDPEISQKLNLFFINYKADVDRGEGRTLRDKYAVQGMPTLLFVDSAGRTLHRTMGYSTPQNFNEQVDIAAMRTPSGLYFSLFEIQYKAQKKPNSTLMAGYLAYRKSIGMKNKDLLDKYIGSLSVNALQKEANEKIILDNAFDLEGKTFDYLLKNKAKQSFSLKLKSMLILNLKEAIEQKDKRHLNKILKINELIQDTPSVSNIENTFMTIDFYRKTGDTKNFHEAVMLFLKNNKGNNSEIVKKKIADLTVYYNQNVKDEKQVLEFKQAVLQE